MPTKGKEYKKFENGSKASILVDQHTGIILNRKNIITLSNYKMLIFNEL